MNFSIASESYKPGYRKLHSEASFDYALNRWLPYMDEPEIRQAAAAIHSIDDWIREFTRLAKVADKTGRWLNASFYYCAAEFYQSRENPGRAQLMKRALQMFDNFIVDWGAERHSVPFKRGLLPTLVLRARGERHDTLVIHGGFDSYKEEFFLAAPAYAEMGFDVVVFDGPGQGQAFREHGLTMSPEWEEPVGAVLDHFKIDDCTLMGFSLGGYLAPRAAAFDSRIKRLIVDDVLDDFLAIHTGKMPPAIASSILKSLEACDAEAVNTTIGQLIEKREAARWTFHHGMEVSGSKDYFEYLCWLDRMQTASFSDRLSQDVLLLAAKEDHIVPLEQFFRQANALTNVRSLTTQLFTRVDHAHNHCHVSNSPMLVDYVLTWLGFQLRLARGRQQLQAI